MIFLKEYVEVFQNRYMWQNFSRMRLKWYFLLKMSSQLIFDVFWQKSEKNLKLEKLENMMKKHSIILKKKRFQFSKRHL